MKIFHEEREKKSRNEKFVRENLIDHLETPK
jgi:hypothetical protein